MTTIRPILRSGALSSGRQAHRPSKEHIDLKVSFAVSTGKVSMSHEDYLEAIVMLGGSPTHPVRSVDVATKMGVSKASVSKAVTSLKAAGLLDQPFYGDITLTEEGFEYGKAIFERHKMLTAFLVKRIGLDPEIAEEEACQMEHAISDESFERWMNYFKDIGL